MEPDRGLFRRRIVAMAQGNRCDAQVEDDFHHMRVWLTHDGHRVLTIDGDMPRPPWNCCPGASAQLGLELVGMPLSTRIWDLPASVQTKLHCTHMLDAALLAIAQAARGGERRYELRVPDRLDERTSPHAHCNGVEVFRMDLEGDNIVAPPSMAGQNVRTILPWARTALSDDDLEVMSMMRRALIVARGRMVRQETLVVGADALSRMAGACYTFQPSNMGKIARSPTWLDLSGHPERFTVQA